MLRLLRTLLAKPKPAAALPRRCRWERVPVGRGRFERAIVCLPEGSGAAPPWPVLYLLHGSGHTPLSYFTLLSMESLLPLAGDACLVFVDGKKGWYLDSPVDASSRREQAFLQVMEDVEKRYPLGRARKNRGICGFSMGGFGAMRIAARHPDLFGSASSLIGPLDIEPLWPDHVALRRLLGTDRHVWQAHNPAASTERLARVRLLVTTARDAWDRPLNQTFVDACRSRGLDVTYREYPGEHGTDFVAAHLREHLEFHVRALWGASGRWEIRAARLEDADALGRNCFSKMSAEEVARYVAWSLAEAARGRRVHLVVDMGEAVANGELSILGDRAEIANLVVAGPLQGRGLGTALIHALAEATESHGVRTLEIGVRSADARTRALYEGQGFSFFREALRPIDGESVPITYLQKQIQANTDEHI